MEEKITKELFANVYGYDSVKKELNRIKEWLSDEELLNNKNVMLPRGILLSGRPGCGKTLMLREFADTFDCPKFIIEGKEENTPKEIIDTFAKAREEKFAIIMVDEIDLLISKSSQIERTFQQELDGINTKGSILVLATTNHINQMDSALLRPGRFDRKINIGYPDKESRKLIFKKFLSDLNLPLDNVDLDHVAKVCNRCNGAEIKAIVNDAYLRCKKDISTEEIERSYDRVVHETYDEQSKEFKDKRVAIHEAGHSLMCLAFPKHFSFYQAKFNECGGTTETQEVDERVDTIEKRFNGLMIGMAGYIAEELYYGKHDVGSYSDYQKVYDAATRLVERVCMYGVKDCILPYGDNNDRFETPAKRKRNEKKVLRLIATYERKTRKYLKKNMQKLVVFANKMFETGKVTYKDIASIMGA